MVDTCQTEYHKFSFRSAGTCGQEIIRNSDGVVVAWTVDAVWAAKTVAGLERNEDET